MTKVEQQEIKGEVKAGLQQMLEKIRLIIADLERQQNLVEKMPIILGKVLVTSGALVLRNNLMDWAFVEVSKEIENEYFKANEMFENPDNIRLDLYKEIPGSITVPAGFKIDTFGSLGSGNYCAKIGRTTAVISAHRRHTAHQQQQKQPARNSAFACQLV
ncbi:hypothetical protein N7486_005616 [Penicillium sp. IBT 16267x]|nr:hypothetical protein N7486_005616 [Penicillium sp. IBT 16267x]